jgi:Secretion system C-terminal sorting domain
MKRVTTKSRRAGIILLLLMFATGVKAQFNIFIRTGDFNGDALSDQLYSGSGVNAGYLGIKHGGTSAWTYYYCGPTFSVANTGLDMDGKAGLEITYWHPSSESFVIITDRTKLTKGYYVGSTGVNAWVQCFNSFTNIDGLAGAEIKINYFNRYTKGYMIIHRNQTTKSTATCASTSRTTGTDTEEAGTIEGPNVMDGVGLDKIPAPIELTSDKPGSNTITITPNPVKAILNIQTGFADEVIASISISDVSGRQVLASTANNRKLDVSRLKSGLYFIRVQTDKKTYTGRMIKE